jgi:REP element-mobilizing transposase RayT
LEINVRTNHVHVVIHANETPKKIIEKLKSRTTMAVNANIRDADGTAIRAATGRLRTLWTRGGSGRYLWNENAVTDACKYVREQDNKHEKP